MPGENLDLSSDAGPARRGDHAESGRPFLGVHSECCDVYTRVYRNPAATHYEGRCRLCARASRFGTASSGTQARFCGRS